MFSLMCYELWVICYEFGVRKFPHFGFLEESSTDGRTLDQNCNGSCSGLRNPKNCYITLIYLYYKYKRTEFDYNLSLGIWNCTTIAFVIQLQIMCCLKQFPIYGPFRLINNNEWLVVDQWSISLLWTRLN